MYTHKYIKQVDLFNVSTNEKLKIKGIKEKLPYYK